MLSHAKGYSMDPKMPLMRDDSLLFSDIMPVALGGLAGMGMGFMLSMLVIVPPHAQRVEECTLEVALRKFPECELVCAL